MLSLPSIARLFAVTSAFAGLSSTSPLNDLQKWQAPSVDTFVSTERPIAVQGILNNIGSKGGKAGGVASGLIVASPSKTNPDYLYAWTRDSALTIKSLVDEYIAGNTDLKPQIENYIYAQASLQAVPNRSGSLSNGAGLGEPKFQVDGTAFNGDWGRPQRDGPSLRATALIAYARSLLAAGNKGLVTSTLWPIISNDLNYVGQYWNQTGFDLWEEVDGSSFFTTAAQHRALVEGNALAGQIGQTCSSCSEAPQILCFLQTFWNGQYIVANINQNNGRSGRDVNSILSSIQTFDPAAGCDDSTFQPCSSRALANHKVVTDSFRAVYGINSGIAEGSAVAVGRYPEDVYQGGNPWYLATLAAAEQLYDAMYQWQKAGEINVDSTSLNFFKDFFPDVAVAKYTNSTEPYSNLIKSIKAYADGFVAIVQKYTPTDGSLAEQFSKSNGTPLSAVDLTWSYASFLTVAARRNGQMPAAWGESSANTVPSTCQGTSATGTYTTPTATTPLAPCTTASTVSVTFNVAATTQFGETILVSGSAAQLGSGRQNMAVILTAGDYQPEYNRWWVTVDFPAGTALTYQYLKKGTNGTVSVESGSKRNYTVPSGCAAEVQIHDSSNL